MLPSAYFRFSATKSAHLKKCRPQRKAVTESCFPAAAINAGYKILSLMLPLAGGVVIFPARAHAAADVKGASPPLQDSVQQFCEGNSLPLTQLAEHS